MQIAMQRSLNWTGRLTHFLPVISGRFTASAGENTRVSLYWHGHSGNGVTVAIRGVAWWIVCRSGEVSSRISQMIPLLKESLHAVTPSNECLSNSATP